MESLPHAPPLVEGVGQQDRRRCADRQQTTDHRRARLVEHAGEGRVEEHEQGCGERRFRAVSLLKAKEDEANVAKIKAHRKKSEKFQTISCIVREMTDDEAFEAMITENLQRKDVDPIEEAFARDLLAPRVLLTKARHHTPASCRSESVLSYKPVLASKRCILPLAIPIISQR